MGSKCLNQEKIVSNEHPDMCHCLFIPDQGQSSAQRFLPCIRIFRHGCYSKYSNILQCTLLEIYRKCSLVSLLNTFLNEVYSLKAPFRNCWEKLTNKHCQAKRKSSKKVGRGGEDEEGKKPPLGTRGAALLGAIQSRPENPICFHRSRWAPTDQ